MSYIDNLFTHLQSSPSKGGVWRLAGAPVSPAPLQIEGGATADYLIGDILGLTDSPSVKFISKTPGDYRFEYTVQCGTNIDTAIVSVTTQYSTLKTKALFYTDHVHPLGTDSAYNVSPNTVIPPTQLTVESFMFNGTELLDKERVSPDGFQRTEDLLNDGNIYGTDLIDMLNGVGATDMQFSTSILRDCVNNYKYFEVCWRAPDEWEIIVSPSGLTGFQTPGYPPSANWSKTRYTNSKVEVYNELTSSWTDVTTQYLTVPECGNIYKPRISNGNNFPNC